MFTGLQVESFGLRNSQNYRVSRRLVSRAAARAGQKAAMREPSLPGSCRGAGQACGRVVRVSAAVDRAATRGPATRQECGCAPGEMRGSRSGGNGVSRRACRYRRHRESVSRHRSRRRDLRIDDRRGSEIGVVSPRRTAVIDCANQIEQRGITAAVD